MKLTQYQTDIIKLLEKAVSEFNNSIPDIQQQALEKTLLNVKDLDIRDGKLVNSAANLKQLAKLKLQDAIVNPELKAAIQKFVDTFDKVAKMQSEYFKAMDIRPPAEILAELQVQAKTSVIKQMSQLIDSRIIPGIEDVLRTNITGGGSYRQMISQLTEYIIGTKAITGSYGKLANDAATLAIDSINTYSAEYSKITSQTFNMEWSMYVGSLLETSRPFCIEMVAKKYIHDKEIPEIMLGKINGKEIPINKKTDLWYGAKEGTNAQNIDTRRGGWKCGHQWLRVSENAVPVQIRIDTYNKYGIKHTNGVKD